MQFAEIVQRDPVYSSLSFSQWKHLANQFDITTGMLTQIYYTNLLQISPVFMHSFYVFVSSILCSFFTCVGPVSTITAQVHKFHHKDPLSHSFIPIDTSLVPHNL